MSKIKELIVPLKVDEELEDIDALTILCDIAILISQYDKIEKIIIKESHSPPLLLLQ